MTEEDTAQDILLSPDERYDVWEIKRVERPYLMEYENEPAEDEDSNGDKEDDGELPLVDGCDVKGWRRSKLVQTSSFAQGVLNVGSGCSLMRRESQLGVVSSKSLSRWKEIQSKLLESPSSKAQRIAAKEARDLSYYPWFEKENVPVILEGLTNDWKANETCTFDRLVKDFGDYDWRFSDTHGATMTLNTYKKYVSSIEGQSDDAPLAVYDSQLHTDERASLLDDYTVPKCFDPPDLFQSMIAGDHDDEDDEKPEMPPYRWILIGPPRSGTGLHIDPLGKYGAIL